MVRKLRTLARPRQRWDNDINIYLQETKWEGVDFIHLVQDKEQWWTFVKTVMNLQVPQNAGPSTAETQLQAYNKIYARVSTVLLQKMFQFYTYFQQWFMVTCKSPHPNHKP